MNVRYCLLMMSWVLCLATAQDAGAAERFWTGDEKAVVPELQFTADQPLDKDAWQIMGKSELVDDEILGRQVLEVVSRARWTLQSKHPLSDNSAIEALVRFSNPTPTAATGSATLRAGITEREGKPFSAYSLTVARRGERSYQILPAAGDGAMRKLPSRTGVPREGNPWLLNVVELFPLNKISPVWDEDFRVGVENDMLALPRECDRWRRLRIEFHPQRVRMYHDGLLAFDEPRGAMTQGVMGIELATHARLAELKVVPLNRVDQKFEPVILEDLCNAAGLVAADSLPPARQPVTVGGVPLVFPARTSAADHVDVGRSLFRYGNSTDAIAGDPQTSWPPMSKLDPARLRVRVPRGAYHRLWLVAAADNDPNNVPLVTVRFYKPQRGWAIDAVAQVPSFTTSTSSKDARRLSVNRPDGGAANLWLLPVELDAAALASELRDEPVFHIELTKEVKGFRAAPDPIFYGSFQAGLPSAVHIFAATLERAPLELVAHGNHRGNTYPAPEKPVWEVHLKNPQPEPQAATVRVTVTSPQGTSKQQEFPITVAGGQETSLDVRPVTSGFGLYQVVTEIVAGDHKQSRPGTFLALPPDTRRATAKDTRWGLWVWGGGHGTVSVPDETLQLCRAFGSLVGGRLKYEDRAKWNIGTTAFLGFRDTPAWAMKDPYDPAEYAKYSEECGLKVVDELKKHPDLQYVSIFAEHSISLRVTHGIPPEAYGKLWYDYTPAEARSIRAHRIAAQAAFEGVRKHAPNVKFLLGHCGPLFALPFMREGISKDLFDGYGLDSPQFERMPERPPRAVECNALYFLNQDMKRLGYKKELIHVESYYPSSHELALGARGSADSTVRTALLSMANGTDKFLACWTLDDCEGAWGSQHYGCIGLIGRKPENNPKPAATAFATMTQMIDTAVFDGYLPTGSRSAYCVRFKETPTKHIYGLWTIRGTRPITITVTPPMGKTPLDEVTLTDESGNSRRLELKEGRATFELSPTPVWLTTSQTTIASADVGAPSYSERPGEQRHLLEDFEKNEWAITGKPDSRYAGNSWDMPRELAPYSASRIQSDERSSRVVRINCDAPPGEANLTGRYGVFQPPEPLSIPGKARAVGLWAKGNSGWGRVVYEIVDAKGEIFQSIGAKDQWNCDDIHSWSYFNYDGWRYLEFPLPNNSPGDDYREKDSVWWSHSAEGVVDLPVKLTKLIFEMPPHQIYVNEMLPVENKTIEIDDLLAVYDSAEDKTDAPILTQRQAAGMLRQKSSGKGLPNPIAELRESGTGAAPRIVKFFAPEQNNDGTRTHVSIEPVPMAKEYQVWVSAYADGRGALTMLKGAAPEPLVNRLRPGVSLYFFVTYTSADGKTSPPSEVATITLKDEFLQK